MHINISSWNILVPKFCNSATYPFSSERALDRKSRQGLITKRLSDRIDQGEDVICLQEVCRESVPYLQTMFAGRGWQFIWEPIGYNQIGSALAISNKLIIDDINIIDVSSTCDKWPVDDKPSLYQRIVKYARNWCNYIFNRGRAKSGFDYPPFWKGMMNKKNSMICAKLNRNGRSFAVASYHMPCHFGNIIAEQQMCAFASLALNALNNYASGLPYALGVDFNTKPRDAAYELATTGCIGDVSKDIGALRPDIWSNNITSTVRSLYKEVTGSEPRSTNRTKTKNGREFCETIDYIFISPEWVCKSVTQINGSSFLPNETEPSDHLMIGGKIWL